MSTELKINDTIVCWPNTKFQQLGRIQAIDPDAPNYRIELAEGTITYLNEKDIKSWGKDS